MQLRGMHLSPYFERAYLVLVVKGATDKVEVAPPPGGFRSQELLNENPIGKVPYLLLDDGTCIPEGQLVAEYFDQVFDGPKLEPDNPVLTAQSRLIARLVDTYIAPQSGVLTRPIFLDFEEDKAVSEMALTEGLPQALDLLENFLHGGEFAVGGSLSFADIALIPHTYFFTEFLKSIGFDPFHMRPKYKEWWHYHKETSLVKESQARVDKSLAEIRAILN